MTAPVKAYALPDTDPAGFLAEWDRDILTPEDRDEIEEDARWALAVEAAEDARSDR